MLRALAAGVALALLTVGAAQDVQTSYELPGDAVFPEGIAIDEANGMFYVTSTSDGTIFRGNLASGEVDTFVAGSEGAAFATIGLDVDDQGRLWVAGGGSGTVSIYDLASGDLINTLQTPEADATFLNDVVVAADGTAYITDSQRPVLFRATADGIEAWVDFSGTAFEYVEGFNANGIVLTSDGNNLLIVQSPTGKIFRVEIASGAVSEVDLGGETLQNGDGLVLEGQTLYVVRNADNEIGIVELAEDFASGSVVGSISDDAFGFPTTAALAGDHLLVVNSQFDKMQAEGGPEPPFTVTSVPVPTP